MRKKNRNLVVGILGVFLVIGVVYVMSQTASFQNLLQGTVTNRGTTHTAWPLVCASQTEPLVFGNDDSNAPVVSGNGRYISYSSKANNLVAGDDNNVADVFVYDRQLGKIERVSVDSNGQQANGTSNAPTISGDGRYVAFVSYATNLVADDSNGLQDIYLHDRQTGTTQRVTHALDGSNTNGVSIQPRLAANGRYITFNSSANNLVANDTNNNPDIFVYDHETATIELVTVATDGSIAISGSDSPDISADGRYVAFASVANNLVADDTNGVYDIFVRDRVAGVTTRVSVGLNGAESNNNSQVPRISDDGQVISYYSQATNLTANDDNQSFDVFVYEQTSGVTTLVSRAEGGTGSATGHSLFHDMADNGRYISYMSLATDLIADDTNGATDIFLYDRETDENFLLSVNADGEQSNLVGDKAAMEQYLQALTSGKTAHSVQSAAGENASPPNDLIHPAISDDGAYIVYDSMASNLVEGDSNEARDIFVTNYTDVSVTPPTMTDFIYLPVIVAP